MDSTTVEKQLAAVVREEVLQSTLMAFRAMYDLSGNVSETVDKYYRPDAEFIDPMVHVTGSDDIKGQFRSLRALFRYTTIEINSHSMDEEARVVIVDSTVTFCFRLLPSFTAISIRQFTTFKLDHTHRIYRHVDHWSVHEVIQRNVPLASVLYGNVWRRSVGKMSSLLTNVLYHLFVSPPSPVATGVKEA